MTSTQGSGWADVRPFRIVRILGVDVIGDASLVALGVLLSWVVYLELRLPAMDASPTVAFVGAIIGGVVFLATVLAHEISHTAMAQRKGVEVTRIRLMIFGGASEMHQDSTTPRAELAIAIVGPITSALLGGLFLLLAWVAAAATPLAGVLRFVGFANLALALFNLLPGLPLDGGRVLRAILWLRRDDRDRATRTVLQAGRFTGLALIGVGIYLALRAEPGAVGIWVAFVGWFLTRMAAGSARAHHLELATRGRTVADLMRPVREAVPGEATVAEALDLYQIGPRVRTLIVEEGGRIVGVLGRLEVEALEVAARETATVSSAMTRIGPADVVEATTPLIDALQREAGATRHIVVVRDGRVVGLVGPEEVAELATLGAVSENPEDVGD